MSTLNNIEIKIKRVIKFPKINDKKIGKYPNNIENKWTYNINKKEKRINRTIRKWIEPCWWSNPRRQKHNQLVVRSNPSP